MVTEHTELLKDNNTTFFFRLESSINDRGEDLAVYIYIIQLYNDYPWQGHQVQTRSNTDLFKPGLTFFISFIWIGKKNQSLDECIDTLYLTFCKFTVNIQKR